MITKCLLISLYLLMYLAGFWKKCLHFFILRKSRLCYTYIISRQTMGQAILPLNLFIAILYFVISGVILVLLKNAVKPRMHLTKASKTQLLNSTKSIINYGKLIILSWLKKYTLIGSCFMKDKKYLLKEFLFIGVYAFTCLNVSQLIIWPIGLSPVILVLSFLFLELLIYKYDQRQVSQINTSKVTLVSPQIQSEIKIQSINIENQRSQAKSQEQVKFDEKKPKTLIEIFVVTSLSFTSIVIMLWTAYSLASSLNEFAQIHIISVLSIFAIDQLALRPLAGGFLWIIYKIITNLSELKPEQFSLVQYLCSEQVTEILISSEKARLIKLSLMTASPLKRKTNSPSKVPKALFQSSDVSSYLNLISLQPTKRQNEGQDEQIQKIYLTTAEKELFENKVILENNSGIETGRKDNKESNHIYSLSAAPKGATKDANENQDLFLIKDEPLHQLQNNFIDEFQLQDQVTNPKRRNYYQKKKNKRNLKLTGSSPYLQYLPDMLKKVDKYKHDHPKKQNDENKRSKKIL